MLPFTVAGPRWIYTNFPIKKLLDADSPDLTNIQLVQLEVITLKVLYMKIAALPDYFFEKF
ncbi:hypothetical protein JOC78_002532 [Bacillus ectoiniformans]|nr:hypothetical protein [Bacillus ectoiniformans]